MAFISYQVGDQSECHEVSKLHKRQHRNASKKTQNAADIREKIDELELLVAHQCKVLAVLVFNNELNKIGPEKSGHQISQKFHHHYHEKMKGNQQKIKITKLTPDSQHRKPCR
jgi:hypothetical protein